jgi:predicted DNA-binding transcriptional regulator YafY
MATNILSKKRTKYVTAKELAEELSTTTMQIYRIFKRPEMQGVLIKIGEKSMRADKDQFYEILKQIYR